jgi:hypothetical protein
MPHVARQRREGRTIPLVADSPFDIASPGARQLARMAVRIREGGMPTEIVLIEDVLDLDGGRTLSSGQSATVPRWLAEALVERGAARLAS